MHIGRKQPRREHFGLTSTQPDKADREPETMIQSMLQTLAKTPRPEPDDSDYDVLAEASISQHIVSRRNGQAAVPSTPSRARTERASVSHSSSRRAVKLQAEALKHQAEADTGEMEELIDVKQVVEALESLRSLIREPSAVDGPQFMDVYVSHTQQLVSAMRMNAVEAKVREEDKDKDKRVGRGQLEEVSGILERKNRGEVMLGIVIVSIRIMRLLIEITTPWLKSLQTFLIRVTENETVGLITEKLAELVLVVLAVALNILKMVQRWTRQ
ncbi:unnamed protein product [Cyberlindnera jadinii]|uniref:Uncharacterized protein n=1 Tax=Cyberlindnera jadinii (strain ATCC 18201 / CBS 1600 / BCRC 20928 / JCM 3617 / NBRC 0987 / NRRL Y-1542) TaxID=983966 RepID=A0A0H5C9C9_CYBJN|nr:unnamed protein product [Cyberlindnera jadinii]